jgi:hypothetical protein
MKRLVEFPSESGEPILVEVEDMGLAGETRRGLSTSAVVERAQTSFEEPWPGLRPAPAIFLALIQQSVWKGCSRKDTMAPIQPRTRADVS